RAEVLGVAAGLKREHPGRTAGQVGRILRAQSGWAPSDRTLQRHFVALELNTRPDGGAPEAFGRFEAAHPNDLWTGDALHGPRLAGRKTYLFAFLDDNSRAAVGYRFGYAEDSVRLAVALRSAMSSRGIRRPGQVVTARRFAYGGRSQARPAPGAHAPVRTPDLP